MTYRETILNTISEAEKRLSTLRSFVTDPVSHQDTYAATVKGSFGEALGTEYTPDMDIAHLQDTVAHLAQLLKA